MLTWLKFIATASFVGYFTYRYIASAIKTGVAKDEFFDVRRDHRPAFFWIEVIGAGTIGVGFIAFTAYLLFWYRAQP